MNRTTQQLPPEKPFFRPNLTSKGRIVRAIGGVGLVVSGLLVAGIHPLICFPLVVGGGFVLFEAARGWCVLRACGIRTKI
ncbi:MAG: DUF2892 domain-containing protein [Limisphaerales bacterium]